MNDKIENELKAGDIFIEHLLQNNEKSNVTKNQLVAEVKILQKQHKLFSSLKIKILLIVGILSLISSIGFFKLGSYFDDTLTYDSGYTADSTSYAYREHTRKGDRANQYYGYGAILFMVPIFEVAIYYVLMNQSKKYLTKINFYQKNT